jgi:hypothetical protein
VDAAGAEFAATHLEASADDSCFVRKQLSGGQQTASLSAGRSGEVRKDRDDAATIQASFQYLGPLNHQCARRPIAGETRPCRTVHEVRQILHRSAVDPREQQRYGRMVVAALGWNRYLSTEVL